ncbi:MAG: methyltransferase domain-containing protein [Roseovarius sp.]|nr:methyltransferase domain-containing protein [Roseovarius sp.]
MTTHAEFWDRIAPKYAQKPIADTTAYETTMRRTRQYLAASDRVLELGCGTGSTAVRLAPDVAQFTGTDISGEMIRIAQGRAEAAGTANLTFATTQAFDLQPPAAPFDTVLAFNLLHLLEDVPAALREIHAQIKPGGLFISKSGCLGGGWPFLRWAIRVMQMVGKAPHVGFFTTRQLEEMISDAGFEILETGDYPAKPPSHLVVARRR